MLPFYSRDSELKGESPSGTEQPTEKGVDLHSHTKQLRGSKGAATANPALGQPLGERCWKGLILLEVREQHQHPRKRPRDSEVGHGRRYSQTDGQT